VQNFKDELWPSKTQTAPKKASHVDGSKAASTAGQVPGSEAQPGGQEADKTSFLQKAWLLITAFKPVYWQVRQQGFCIAAYLCFDGAQMPAG
jgi:hypothetical protein